MWEKRDRHDREKSSFSLSPSPVRKTVHIYGRISFDGVLNHTILTHN